MEICKDIKEERKEKRGKGMRERVCGEYGRTKRDEREK